jgi:hypothetical protein
MKRFIIILAVILPAIPAIPQDFEPDENLMRSLESADTAKDTSRFYNNRGMDEYHRGDIKKAAHYFLLSLRKDDTNYLAHYNYACMLSLLRKESSICDYAFIGEIQTHLARSIGLKKERRKRMMEDEDLAHLRGYPFFRMLALDPGEGVSSMLRKAGTWYGPKPGVYPASPEMYFMNNGKLFLNAIHLDENGVVTGKDEMKGSYEVNGSRIRVRMPGWGSGVMEGRIEMKVSDGVVLSIYIVFPDLRLSLDDDPCSA